MNLSVSRNSGVITIGLSEKFEFSSMDEFRQAYVKSDGSAYVVDFRNTDYMDSSGLGMLLNMRRHLEDGQISIKLINCRPQVKKVLMISRFETKFEIA